MYISMRLELKEIPSEPLSELIKEAVDILKERSEIPGKATHIKPAVKRGPYKKKEKMTRKKIPYKKSKGRRGRDFTEIDKIVKNYYGKKSYKEIIEIAKQKGIKIKHYEIDYRRRKLKIAKASRKYSSGSLKEVKKKEKTDKELIEEASNIKLGDLSKKEESETPAEEYDSAESYDN